MLLRHHVHEIDRLTKTAAHQLPGWERESQLVRQFIFKYRANIFFIQMVKRVSEDSENTVRTAVNVLNIDLLGFSNILV